MAKIFTVWIEEHRGESFLVFLDLASDPLHLAGEENDWKNDQREPQKDDQGELPGEIEAGGQSRNDRKRRLEIVCKARVERGSDLPCISDGAGRKAA